MTELTTDQEQRMEAAAGSVGAKLRALHAGLTPDERQVLVAALRSIGAGADEEAGDVAGYVASMGPQLVGVGIAQQLAVRELVKGVLDLFGVRT